MVRRARVRTLVARQSSFWWTRDKYRCLIFGYQWYQQTVQLIHSQRATFPAIRVSTDFFLQTDLFVTTSGGRVGRKGESVHPRPSAERAPLHKEGRGQQLHETGAEGSAGTRRRAHNGSKEFPKMKVQSLHVFLARCPPACTPPIKQQHWNSRNAEKREPSGPPKSTPTPRQTCNPTISARRCLAKHGTQELKNERKEGKKWKKEQN